MTKYFQSVSNSLAKIAAALVTGLVISQGASAATTTLTFDEFSDGTTVTTQYQSLGVLASGVKILNDLISPWPSNSSPNVAFAPTGLMTFTLNSSIVGNIQSVSAYVSGDTSVGIYAYDLNGALVGQAQTPGAANNLLITATSSGNPITKVEIHNGGATFTIDTLDFVTPPPPPPPPSSPLELTNLYLDKVVALSASDFNKPAQFDKKEELMLRDIRYLKKLLNSATKDDRLVHQVKKLQRDVSKFINPASPAQAELFDLLDQLMEAILDVSAC